jgi:NDP-sugar pyrophosphorylase family protein
MILAAGHGTRLRPLTNSKPKALIEVAGVPLLEHVVLRLKKHGVDEVIINVHHLAEQILAFLKERDHFGMRIEVSIEEELLGIGGGLKRAAWFLDDDQPFLLHNVDVLTDLDLLQMVQAHRSSGALATLAVRQRKTSRYFLFDDDSRLVGWQSVGRQPPHPEPVGVNRRLVRQPSGEITALSFMGIHVLSPRIFNLLTEEAPFSIRDVYLRLAAAGERILAFRADHARWLDLGRPENLAQAEEILGEEFFQSTE